jgi:hypothetical protein
VHHDVSILTCNLLVTLCWASFYLLICHCTVVMCPLPPPHLWGMCSNRFHGWLELQITPNIWHSEKRQKYRDAKMTNAYSLGVGEGIKRGRHFQGSETTLHEVCNGWHMTYTCQNPWNVKHKLWVIWTRSFGQHNDAGSSVVTSTTLMQDANNRETRWGEEALEGTSQYFLFSFPVNLKLL